MSCRVSTNSRKAEALPRCHSWKQRGSERERAKASPRDLARSCLFDTRNWGAFCDVTLTLRQARRPDCGGWVKIDDHQCRRAFQHFMNRLNRCVHGAAFRRHRKRLRVIPVLEKSESCACASPSNQSHTSGRWHIHCAIELPAHIDAIEFERRIHRCWAEVEWSRSGILVRDDADERWIGYMLKDRQKSEFENLLDSLIIESLYNPTADA